MSFPTDTDLDVEALLDTARDRLLTFATVEWVSRVPQFVGSLKELLGSLLPGVSLGNQYPEDFACLPQVHISIANTASLPSTTSPITLPLPVTLPLTSRTPSSGSTSAPLLETVSGAMPECRSRHNLPARMGASYQSRRAASSPEDVEEVSPVSAPCTSQKQSAPEELSEMLECKPNRPCQPCASQKRKCTILSGANPKDPCVPCVWTKKSCDWLHSVKLPVPVTLSGM